jgi:peptide/nickel transport system substrate-binding protein
MRRTVFFLALGALVLAGPLRATAQPAGRVVLAQGVDPTTLDPHHHQEAPAANVLLNIYDTLLFLDKDLKLIPWLAESWRAVNPTTWEFKIRKGVKFHNGEEVDAEAVKFSFERIVNPDLKVRQGPNFTRLDRVEAIDKHTVRIITKKPWPILENQLASEGSIVPPKYFREKDAAFLAKNPVGSGPYKFVTWAKDEAITLEANASWWGGAPKVKTLVFRPIPEHATRVAALQAGEVDIVTNVPPHLVKQIESDPKLYVSRAPSVRVIYVSISTHKYDKEHRVLGPVDWPTKDKRVRQAINHAVNADEIIANVLEGNGIRTATVLTSKHFGFDPKLQPYQHDVAKAKQLLTEAGYPNGIDIVLNSPDGRYLKDKEVAEALAGQLTKAGIRTTVKTFEWGTYLNQMQYVHGGGAHVPVRLGEHDLGRRRHPDPDLSLGEGVLELLQRAVRPPARRGGHDRRPQGPPGALHQGAADPHGRRSGHPALPAGGHLRGRQARQIPGPVLGAARGRPDLPGGSDVLGGDRESVLGGLLPGHRLPRGPGRREGLVAQGGAGGRQVALVHRTPADAHDVSDRVAQRVLRPEQAGRPLAFPAVH